MELKFIKTRIQINRLILTILIFLSIIEAISLVVQYVEFQRIRASLEQRLVISEKEKLNLRTELGEARTKLLSQEEFYNQVFKEKETLNLELNDLKLTLSQLEELLNQARNEKQVLEGQAKKTNRELVSLKQNARLLEGKINALDEVKLFLDTRLEVLKELQQRIRNFKREALLNKIKAQAELDRVKLELGNRGFVTKSGKSTVNTQRAIELEKIVIKVLPSENIGQ